MQFSDADIKKAGSKNLAGYVVAYRLLKIYKELSILCMEELMSRRAAGDDFNFEEYIENELKDAPKPNDLKNISGILKGIVK
jgi:hypothetical protein